jgi:hypothetical protein
MEKDSNNEKISNIIDNDNYSSSDEEKKNSNIKSSENTEKIDDNSSDSEIIDENKIYEDKKDITEDNNATYQIEKDLLDSINKKENVTKENLILAEQIDFKNKPDKILETDQFGFITKNESEADNNKKKLSKNDLLTINARTEKWRYMIEHIDIYKTKKKNKLKERTRKGIPDSLRSQIWQLFGGIDKYNKNNIFENVEKEKLDQDTEITIIKDLDRTFPGCSLFTDKYGGGQRKLFKVLSNYSKYNKEIGYVQGMGYIAALFLIYMDERSSFYLLHSIIKNYELESIILPGFPGLKKKFYVLLNLEKKFVPKVYEILKRDEIFPSLYASEWFICLFSKDLKPSVLVRIFDTFLYEGYKVIYRFALAFLKMKENEFIRCKPGVMFTMDIVKELLCDIDVDILFKTAFNFHLSKKHIVKYEKEYEENKDNENNEFIKQL